MMGNKMMAMETARFSPARREVRHSVFIIRICDPISHSRSAVPGGKGPLSPVMEWGYIARHAVTQPRQEQHRHATTGRVRPVKHDLEGFLRRHRPIFVLHV